MTYDRFTLFAVRLMALPAIFLFVTGCASAKTASQLTNSSCVHNSLKKGCSPATAVTLSAQPTSILIGQGSALSWSSQNATTLDLEPGIGSVVSQGLVTVFPTVTTTYTITATGSGGTATASATVTVTLPAPTVNLSADPGSITAGQSATLSWSSQYASSLDLEPGVGPVGGQGSVAVSPAQTTNYTLTATGSGGTTTASTTITVVPAGVQLFPGDDIQAAVNAYPSGTTFILNPGIYRMQSVTPKSGDFFSGQPGAVLNGSILITSWQSGTGLWTAQVYGITQQSSYRGQCLSTNTACAYLEDLFYDSKPLKRVGTLAEVVAGTWYFDYASGEVYSGTDPSSHTTEISAIHNAFNGTASNVKISNLAIQKYASFSALGAVQASSNTYAPSSGWIIDSCDVSLNHGWGIRLSNGTQLTNNKIHDNGQMGYGGSGSGILIENNEIYNNNFAGYNWNWEAGGGKVTSSINVTIRSNYSHDNQGPGLWSDINDDYVLYENNHTARNVMAGIDHEISYHATIRNNLVEDDGFSPLGTNLWWGAGILIINSSNVEVYGNTVTDCMNGIGGILADRGNAPDGTPYLIQNLYVHDNIITQQVNYAAGIVKAVDYDDSVYTSWGNHFQNNTFYLLNPTQAYFYWLGQRWTLDQWNLYSAEH